MCLNKNTWITNNQTKDILWDSGDGMTSESEDDKNCHGGDSHNSNKINPQIYV